MAELVDWKERKYGGPRLVTSKLIKLLLIGQKAMDQQNTKVLAGSRLKAHLGQVGMMSKMKSQSTIRYMIARVAHGRLEEMDNHC